MKPSRRLAVIVPCHNESENIRPFYDAAKPVLESLPVSWTLLYINDASSDDTLEKILEIRKTDRRVQVATLSRNSGYHAALVAGLSNIDADLYSIIDVDCEDPPELLSQFYAQIEQGSHTVYGIRSQRPEPRIIVFFRWLFYQINKLIADGPIHLWMAEFSMFSRHVRDQILANKTTFPFLRAELAYVGLEIVGIPYTRQPRIRGVSHYNFFTMAKFAVGGFLASSTFPLRATLYISIGTLGLYLTLLTLLKPGLEGAGALSQILGFTYLLTTIPILSLYLARTYKNVTGRPVYFLNPDKSHLD